MPTNAIGRTIARRRIELIAIVVVVLVVLIIVVAVATNTALDTKGPQINFICSSFYTIIARQDGDFTIPAHVLKSQIGVVGGNAIAHKQFRAKRILSFNANSTVSVSI